MLVMVARPSEFHSEEVCDFTHEVNSGEGVKFLFKLDFTLAIWAKIHEIVHI